MNEASIMNTLMHPSSSLYKDENEKPDSENEFRDLIG